jgi:hypothetical protein
MRDRRCRLAALLVMCLASLLIPIAGCSPSNIFEGRLFVINATGRVMRSSTLSNVDPGTNQVFTLPDLVDGQAWVGDFRHDRSLLVLGNLKLSYVDHSGARRTGVIPFSQEIPDFYRDDFFIEVGPAGQLGWGRLTARDRGELSAVLVWTHAFAGAIGMMLGWLLWSRGRSASGRPQRRNKAVDLEF